MNKSMRGSRIEPKKDIPNTPKTKRMKTEVVQKELTHR